DQIIHGSANLRGWSGSGMPDPTLLLVDGFDPSRREYQYTVNRRFGSTRPSDTNLLVPFRAIISARIEVGPPLQHQEFDRFRSMDALRNNLSAAPVDSLRVRLAETVADGYRVLLRNRDSLLLTESQADSLRAADAAYRVRTDSIWQQLAEWIGRQDPHRLDFGQIRRQVDDAAGRVWETQRSELERIKHTLASAQWELAKSMLEFLIRSKEHPTTIHLF
ncbi:MAG TPA: hypothetical protein VK636_04565, partial [Gemmatimonadaceae bacterium]|nr:hypothetical protein [Gemmatimonadaceae bacterium]